MGYFFYCSNNTFYVYIFSRRAFQLFKIRKILACDLFHLRLKYISCFLGFPREKKLLLLILENENSQRFLISCGRRDAFFLFHFYILCYGYETLSMNIIFSQICQIVQSQETFCIQKVKFTYTA